MNTARNRLLTSFLGFFVCVVLMLHPLTRPLVVLPIFFIALTVGYHRAVIVALAVIGFLLLGGNFEMAGYTLGILFAPCYLIVWCALISRPAKGTSKDDAENTTYEFYPPTQTILWMLSYAFVAAVAFHFTAFVLGASPSERIAEMMLTEPALNSALINSDQLTQSDLQWLVRLSLILFPSFWMVLILGGLQLMQSLARAFDVNIRPTPDYDTMHWHRDVGHALMLAMLASGFGGIIAPTETLADMFFAIAASLFTAFFLLGLAGIHARLRPVPFRGAFLVATYLAIFIFIWVAIPIGFYGMVRQTQMVQQRS